jgi:hypothetical protein
VVALRACGSSEAAGASLGRTGRLAPNTDANLARNASVPAEGADGQAAAAGPLCGGPRGAGRRQQGKAHLRPGLEEARSRLSPIQNYVFFKTLCSSSTLPTPCYSSLRRRHRQDRLASMMLLCSTRKPPDARCRQGHPEGSEFWNEPSLYTSQPCKLALTSTERYKCVPHVEVRDKHAHKERRAAELVERRSFSGICSSRIAESLHPWSVRFVRALCLAARGAPARVLDSTGRIRHRQLSSGCYRWTNRRPARQ